MSDIRRDRLVGPLLKDRVAIVTGAAGGIGKIIVTELLYQGAHVVASDIVSDVSGDQIERECLTVVQGDITSPDVQAELLTTTRSLGGVDILVNNAARVNFGTDIRLDPSEDETQSVFAVNIHAARRLGHAAARQMIELDIPGNITFITSVHASLVRMQEHYHASKAAAEAIMREMAIQYGPDGIRVNAIAPGAIHTEGNPTEAALQAGHFRHQTALGRKGTPQEVANAIVFLASNAASYITGTTLQVDGGLSQYNWITDEYLKKRYGS